MRPRDAFEFLLPDIHSFRGDPASWEFLSTQVRKKDLRGKGFTMDLCIRYAFPSGTPLLLVLVEHWATSRSMDLVRTAHYYLDLLGRFPECEIVPVALITEPEPHAVRSQLTGSGAGEQFLQFHTRVVQLATMDCEAWANASNLVAATQLINMGGSLDRVQRFLRSIEAFRREATDAETQQLFSLLTELGKLSDEEEETAMSYLASLPKPRILVKMEQRAIEEGLRKGMEQGIECGIERGMERGMEEGIRLSKREDARKMLDRGCDWAFVTDITGLHPEDLTDSDQART